MAILLVLENLTGCLELITGIFSAERANEIYKYMSKELIDKRQVVKILGKADRELFDAKDPYGVKNIRIGITLLKNESISKFQKSLPN